MFWKSIIDGLAVFGHWQIWIALIIYTAVIFGFMMVIVLVVWKNEEAPQRMLIGSLSYMIGSIARALWSLSDADTKRIDLPAFFK